MAEKEVSDKDLDKMIDESIKQDKAEGKQKKKEEKTKEVKPKTEAKKDKSEVSTESSEKAQKPKKEVPSLKPVEGYDPWSILMYPHLTEKSMNLVERSNVLVFIVDMKATKALVKEAVEKAFGAKVVSVKIEITRKNQKKAYVRLAEGVVASDIATRLGMI